jgi:hypothetical protein
MHIVVFWVLTPFSLIMFDKNMLPSLFKTYLYLDEGGNTSQFYPENKDSMFLRAIGAHLPDYKVS